MREGIARGIWESPEQRERSRQDMARAVCEGEGGTVAEDREYRHQSERSRNTASRP